MADRVQISHYYTTGGTSPNTSKLILGELAMSIKSGNETLFLKNTDSKITSFSSDEKFLKQKNTFSGSTTFNSGITVNNSNITINNGNVTSSGGFYDTSDERLKIFENEINVSLDDIKNIKKTYFYYKHDDNKEKHIGVSAQDIEKIYPEIININSEGYLTVDYSKLSVIALKAIDVLTEENKILKTKLTDLEKRLELLEKIK